MPETYSAIPAFEGSRTIGHRYPAGPTCIVCSISVDPGDHIFTLEEEVDPSQICVVCGETI